MTPTDGNGAKTRIVFWIWLMMVVAYLDRVNITIAGPTIMHALHIGPARFGIVLGAFTFGYALMQIPGGYLADRLGAKPLLLWALGAWSLFTAATAATWSFLSLTVVRALFGLGEGLENGAQFKLIGDNFDSRERSNANALFLTAIAIGPAITAPFAAWIIGRIGWRGLFLAFAALGIVVVCLMAVFLPKSATRVDGTTDRPASHHLGWRDALGQPVTWLAFSAYFFFNVAFWGFLGWMPTYLSTSRHITLAHLGFAASVPYVCGFIGMVAIGQLGSHRFYRFRAMTIGVSYLLAGLFLFFTCRAVTIPTCIAGLSAAGFFLYGGFGPFWAITLDIVPEDLRGAFTGLVNFGGQVGAFLASIVVGEIVQRTHSFTGGFLFMIAALVLSAVSLFALQGAGKHRQREMPA